MGKDWWDDSREWVRRTRDGQRGYLVMEGGEQRVALDRPNHTNTLPYNSREWQPEKEGRPLTPAQAAQVAFEADKGLCMVFGDYENARRDWQSLSDVERLSFIKEPPEDPVRANLWTAVMRYMKEVRR